MSEQPVIRCFVVVLGMSATGILASLLFASFSSNKIFAIIMPIFLILGFILGFIDYRILNRRAAQVEIRELDDSASAEDHGHQGTSQRAELYQEI
jgi:F0F1-type ATP synthase assembly protein I